MENVENEYLASHIVKMLKLDIKQPALVKAEKNGRIPQAVRRRKGRVDFRYWPTKSLPKIGAVFGKFKKPLKTEVFCVYAPKGGIGKSCFTFNFSRVLALHDLRVLVIGMDFQCTLSKNFGLSYEDDSQIPLSLFDCFAKENKTLKDLILKTDIPNLFFIPESNELNVLDNYLFAKNRREYLLKDALEEIKGVFDVVIIDCPPYWNQSVTNALVAANRIIAPINSDGESYHSFKIYMRELKKFMERLKKGFDSVKFIANYVDLRNKYTTDFKNKLISEYGPVFTSAYLRDSVTVKEAGSARKSVIEYSPSSNVADDFYNAMFEVWSDVETEGEETLDS